MERFFRFNRYVMLWGKILVGAIMTGRHVPFVRQRGPQVRFRLRDRLGRGDDALHPALDRFRRRRRASPARGRHVSMEAFFNLWPRELQRIGFLAINLFCIVTIAVIVYFGIGMVRMVVETDQVSEAAFLPMWIIYGAFPGGGRPDDPRLHRNRRCGSGGTYRSPRPISHSPMGGINAHVDDALHRRFYPAAPYIPMFVLMVATPSSSSWPHETPPLILIATPDVREHRQVRAHGHPLLHLRRGGHGRRRVLAAARRLGRIPRRMDARRVRAMTTIVSCEMFGTVSGSSAATTAAIGSILYPPLIKNRYGETFSLGLVTCTGAIASVIPPSIGMIVLTRRLPGHPRGRSLSAGSSRGSSWGVLFGCWVLVHVYRENIPRTGRSRLASCSRGPGPRGGRSGCPC